MIDNQTTPEEIARGQFSEQDTDSWFAIATARQLETFILCKKPYTHGNKSIETVKAIESIERAQIALNIRLAENAAKTAEKMSQQTDKLIHHTEQLTKQTATHIQFSEKLTQQTDKLITESVSLTGLTKQLRFWTIMLGVFVVVQIFIMVFDFLKHN